MNWFYALNNQQAGPVDDAELARLVQTGVISGGTLIWHSGLPNWQTYDAVRLAAAPGAAAIVPAAVVLAPGEVSMFAMRPGVSRRRGRARRRVRGLRRMQAGAHPEIASRARSPATPTPRRGPTPRSASGLGAAILDGVILLPFFVVIYAAYFYLFVFRYANLTQPQNHFLVPCCCKASGVVFGLVLSLDPGCVQRVLRQPLGRDAGQAHLRTAHRARRRLAADRRARVRAVLRQGPAARGAVARPDSTACSTTRSSFPTPSAARCTTRFATRA